MDKIQIIKILVTCFTFSAIITPVIKKIAIHVGAVDVPDARKVHTKPMPRLGGLSIFCGFLLGYMLFGDRSPEMISILIGGFIVIITGIIDDIKPLPASIKFSAQFCAALVVTLYGGILLRDINAFGIYLPFGIFSYPLTIFFILGAINCINLIDGLDGLAAGISAIFFLTIGIIATIQNLMGGLDVCLAFIMLGSVLGFLVHNFYPAKIFMGDSGSMFLGFIISIISLLGFKNVTVTSLIIPCLLLAIPIMDTLFAIFRRMLKGESISNPDKQHLHHQLLKLNLSHRNTVLVIYLIDILFALASIVYVIGDPQLGKVIYAVLILGMAIIITRTSIIADRRTLKVNYLLIKRKFRKRKSQAAKNITKLEED